MTPLLALHVTEVGIAVKIWRLVIFYCIEPHCAGWRIFQGDT